MLHWVEGGYVTSCLIKLERHIQQYCQIRWVNSNPSSSDDKERALALAPLLLLGVGCIGSCSCR